MPDQKPMWTRCLGWFSVMWVTKLMISQVKKKKKNPKNDQIWPKIGIFGQLGRGHAGLFSALLVGRLVVVARAVSRKTPIYVIFLVQKAICVLLCGFSTCDFVFLTLIQLLSKQPLSTWQVVRTTTSFSWWSQYIFFLMITIYLITPWRGEASNKRTPPRMKIPSFSQKFPS